MGAGISVSPGPTEVLGSGSESAAPRRDFPILARRFHGKPLVYLDNAASTQKPRAVIDVMSRYYEEDNANVHRGVHSLGDLATAQYERSREVARRFLNARESREIVFTRGATESINLVAQTFGRQQVGPGDDVIVSWMEHHANIVPWQMLCRERGASLKVVPVTEAGDLKLDELEALMTPRTRLVAISHVSNVLGTVNPVRSVVELAHARNIPVLVDGAQAVAHLDVDVRDLDCDFYAFSGHKVYGPMGIGVLYAKARHLEEMPPWQGGGDMVRSVRFEETNYNEPPFKFEAGTPNVAGAVGLAAALEYLASRDRGVVHAHESKLLEMAESGLRAIPGVRVIGDPASRAGVISFVVDRPALSALDVGSRLSLDGIAVRSGHHCCQPLHERMGVPATVRASVAIYNTADEIERFAASLRTIVTAPTSARRDRAAGVAAGQVDVSYPATVGKSADAAAAEFAEELEFLDDWTQRYQYLLELGESMIAMPGELKTEANRVRGCLSVSYLAIRQRPGTTDVVEFLADSDGGIVRGLMALLQRVLSGRSANEVLAFDLTDYFSKIGLEENLTANRRNGLADIIRRLREFASNLEHAAR
jgi:cysteine desulfurase/selenocysteine lyase